MRELPPHVAKRDEVILEGILAGNRKKNIAASVGISYALLNFSLRRIFAKLGVRNLIELGAWAQRNGRMQDER